MEWQMVRQKRKAGGSSTSAGSSPPPTSNRFQTLTSDDEADQEDDEGAESQPRRPAAARPRVVRSAKKAKPTPVARVTTPRRSPAPTALTTSPTTPAAGTRLYKYRGDKDKWTIKPATDTHSIIIGDSNLSNITKIAEGFEVHCMPGAHFRHVIAAVDSIPQVPHDKYVVFIQAGINHRERYDTTVQKEIQELTMKLMMNPGIRRVLHIGVSFPDTLSQEEKDNMDKINAEFQHCLQAENCIDPLSPSEVQIRINDQHGIHHTTATAEKIFGPLFELDF
ncbi:hypothetical protein HC928_12485 [bacterium]|nr:hypothetical protein [bacterium]